MISTRVGYAGGRVAHATDRNHHGTPRRSRSSSIPPPSRSGRCWRSFFKIHDPTTRDRQGNDRGTSYRSATFTNADQQLHEAADTIAEVEASGLWPGKMVTTIEPVGDFWESEPEHHDYLERMPN